MKELDLTKKEDLKEFKDTIAELKDNKLFMSLMNLFTEDDSVLDSLVDLADEVYNSAHEDDVKEAPVVEEPKFEIPSSKLTVDQGLKIHKIVQEYVDTMIRPYAPAETSNKTINDLYASLYEFAAWVLHK